MDQHGILLPLMKVEEGSVHSRTVLFQDLGCDQALAPDPYESKLVKVASSSRRNGGEGIFAKKFLESNTIISFYFGERVSPQDFNLDSWDGNCYKIFDPRDYPRGTIDIPAWAQVSSADSHIFFEIRMFQSTDSYCATLAHKTNHSFQPNSQFIVYDHPLFGIIPAIITIRDVEEGEEVFVSYGYDLLESPQWYREEWQMSEYKEAGVSFADWQTCRVRVRRGEDNSWEVVKY